MKKYKIIIIIIIFAGIIFLAGRLLTEKKPDVKDGDNIVRVKRGDLSVSVDVKAVIKPLNVMEIKSRVKGKIIKMPAQKGEFLEKGSLAAEIQNTFLMSAVDQSLLELNKAKAGLEKIRSEVETEKERNQQLLKTAEKNLEKAKLELQKAVEMEKIKEALKKNNIETESELIKQEVGLRLTINDMQKKISKLNEKKPVPLKELETAKISLESARSEYELVLQYLALAEKPIVEEKIDVEKFGIKQAELELQKTKERIKTRETRDKDMITMEAEVLKKQEAFKIAEDNLKETIIAAPISGTVLEKNIEEGGIITPGMLMDPEGYTLASMTNLEKVYITANVNEKDAGKIRRGQSVKVIADIFPKNIFMGRITKIIPKKTAIKDIKISEITVELKNPKELFLTGMNVGLKIIIKESKNVLFVPNDVIQNVDNKKRVIVMQDGKPVQREVKTGSNNRDFTEILSGLKEGEIISKPGKSMINDL